MRNYKITAQRIIDLEIIVPALSYSEAECIADELITDDFRITNSVFKIVDVERVSPWNTSQPA